MISVLLQRSCKATLAAALRARSALRLSSKRDQIYFGYGANLDPNHLRESGLDADFLGPAVLADHALDFSMPCEYYGVGYASVSHRPGATVYGALYAMDSLSLALLDIMEWVPFGAYCRSPHAVTLVGGDSAQAQVYQAANPRAGLLPPLEYRDWLVESARKLGVPADYLVELQRQATCEPKEIDPEFDLLFQGRLRPGSRLPILRGLYQLSDKIRERIAEAL